MKQQLTWGVIAVVLACGSYASRVVATPGQNFMPTTIAKGTFDEIDLQTHTIPAFWNAQLRTKGLSDLYVQSNEWQPGGTTGWHTHPGLSLVIVTEGMVTAYEGDDPGCAPHVYQQGMSFVDVVNGHTHVLRNESSVVARTVAVQLITAAAVRRIDAPHPDNCPAGIN
jgi:hypothetical protein